MEPSILSCEPTRLAQYWINKLTYMDEPYFCPPTLPTLYNMSQLLHQEPMRHFTDRETGDEMLFGDFGELFSAGHSLHCSFSLPLIVLVCMLYSILFTRWWILRKWDTFCTQKHMTYSPILYSQISANIDCQMIRYQLKSDSSSNIILHGLTINQHFINSNKMQNVIHNNDVA